MFNTESGESRERSGRLCRVSKKWGERSSLLLGCVIRLDPLQTSPPLPSRQSVVEIPNIEWKGYIESLQQVAKQHSNLYINTRGQSRPLITSLEEKPLVQCVCVCCVCMVCVWCVCVYIPHPRSLLSLRARTSTDQPLIGSPGLQRNR